MVNGLAGRLLLTSRHLLFVEVVARIRLVPETQQLATKIRFRSQSTAATTHRVALDIYAVVTLCDCY